MENTEQREKITVENFIDQALKKRYGFAFWRLPGENKIKAVSGSIIKEFNPNSNGFLISSFEGDKYFINQELKTSFSTQNLENLNNLTTELFYKPPNSNTSNESTSEFEYKLQCKKALKSISKGEIKKIVLARTIKIELEKDFLPVQFFLNLVKTYTNAFVSFVSLPETGTWIGATPETLLNISKGFLSTMSLAGTCYLSSGTTPSLSHFSEKELKEQELVSQYIRKTFESSGIDFNEEPPKAVNAGHITHIQGIFKAYINGNSNYLKFLNILHPTPAVCGLPKNIAYNYILKNEKFKRYLYSGYLGPVYQKNNLNLFVNLRCMQISGNIGMIYTGAGIVEDSEPDSEWIETNKKAETLLKILYPDQYKINE